MRLLALLLFCGVSAAEPPILRPLASWKEDCGCSLKAGKKYLFGVGGDEVGHANLGGHEVELQRVGEVDTSHDQVGGRYFELWQAGAFNLRIDYRVTKTCGHGLPTEEQGCEGIEVRATITVSDGKHQQKTAATGYCGC